MQTEPTPTPFPPAARAEAEALLRRITLRNLRTREVRTGIHWTAVLCIDGQPALQITQEGRGGCNRYAPEYGNDFAAARKIQTLIEGACTVLGLGDFEPLDALTAAMEPGKTALDSLPLARSAVE